MLAFEEGVPIPIDGGRVAVPQKIRRFFPDLDFVRPSFWSAFYLTGKHPYYIKKDVDPLFER